LYRVRPPFSFKRRLNV